MPHGPTPSDRVPALPILEIYAYTICRRFTKFDVVTRGGGACILWSATPPIPRERSYGSPIIEVLLYLCLHTLTQNDQIWHCTTCREGHVFRRSGTPLYLHKSCRVVFRCQLSFLLTLCQCSILMSSIYLFHLRNKVLQL